MSARPKRVGLLGEEVGGVMGEATLHSYTGHVTGTGTFNGRYFEITFTSSAFRNRNWRCAMLTSFGFPWPRVPLGGWRKAKRRARHPLDAEGVSPSRAARAAVGSGGNAVPAIQRVQVYLIGLAAPFLRYSSGTRLPTY
jgi:hypothetical protein